ncbi:MerR family transcriptional regulator [Kribbella shirazensis]|uniref:DNA-binding transcriptional MerR regulator n=1 Tax=Kribbella shirazensis TaxID=1105143 RepID=A0A7X5VI00_9ACTN|nr:MerR family transcriptional regulator [Kribbella shirazensis]NIK60847.1 DNA-binding transcriptional MerR regulator [Kribbella shirazensis]
MLTIGELASRCGLATHVLRHWEDEGLLTPARVSGRRQYDDAQVARVVMIQRAKAAGLGLPRIRRMLDAPDGAERRTVLVEQDALLDEQIRRAQESKRLISHALSCEAPDFTECSHFHRLLAELGSRTG